ncbi:hypothetical protein [Methylobacterium nonmethylotrophicum]|uniref:hypothetical protein n=1 Tax=Methylobacterium nonmethylotrophicum TaxID=1141884 RepID=UPI001436A094|nr:hypothetical protein [Methylobacterium nonmethylotrophicum]
MAAHDTTPEPMVRFSTLIETQQAVLRVIRDMVNFERDAQDLRRALETAAADIARGEIAFRDVLAARPDQVRQIADEGARALRAAHRAALARIEEIDRISARQREQSPAANVVPFPGRRA